MQDICTYKITKCDLDLHGQSLIRLNYDISQIIVPGVDFDKYSHIYSHKE